MEQATVHRGVGIRLDWVALVLCLAGAGLAVWFFSKPRAPTPLARGDEAEEEVRPMRPTQPRNPAFDDSGFTVVVAQLPRWDPRSLDSIRESFRDIRHRQLPPLQAQLANPGASDVDRAGALANMAMVYLYEAEPQEAYDALTRSRALLEVDRTGAGEVLSQIIFLQGVAGLRRGENDNCVLCRGEGSCIFPILPAAVHKEPAGSRLAVKHFTEYLQRHPDELGVRWLLNVAYMTLGEYPAKVPAAYLIPMERFRTEREHSIGAFTDVAHRVGVNRLNMAGGAIMEDFDNDGLLDILASSWDAAMPLALFRNKGDGTFEDRANAAGLANQFGGLYCVQTDYNNDGWMDMFVIRGAWMSQPMRPSLLRNNGDGTFTDVTQEAGLMHPVNAIAACWADYDNDGHLDLFIGCEGTPNLLFRNKGDGTFEEVGARAGVAGTGGVCKGANWGDFDGDGWPDLFLNNLDGPPKLFRNNRNGTFTDVARDMGITAPTMGFACWFFDYDNDGWLDIYATAYERNLDDVVKGLIGEPAGAQTGRLYRNVGGKRFEDVTRAAGLDVVTVPMGCNFGDFDNDGWLDFYLGTGWPPLSALRPNRMFRNLGGKRFADITIPSRTGHLQKGHAVACGDWDRDGNVDLFQCMGGATPGDRFHNVLFQNPGLGNRSLTVKLVGKKTNRAAIGARIKAVTAGAQPMTVYRHVTSGSSFGANPLEQTMGLGKADGVATLEVYWPTSGTTQVFHDVPAGGAIEVTEFATTYRRIEHKRVPLPKE